MADSKTRKLEICTASDDLPLISIRLPLPLLPRAPDDQEIRNAVDVIATCFYQSIVSWQILDSKSDLHPEMTKFGIAHIFDFFVESFGTVI
jgi:hypothetical protein